MVIDCEWAPLGWATRATPRTYPEGHSATPIALSHPLQTAYSPFSSRAGSDPVTNVTSPTAQWRFDKIALVGPPPPGARSRSLPHLTPETQAIGTTVGKLLTLLGAGH